MGRFSNAIATECPWVPVHSLAGWQWEPELVLTSKVQAPTTTTSTTSWLAHSNIFLSFGSFLSTLTRSLQQHLNKGTLWKCITTEKKRCLICWWFVTLLLLSVKTSHKSHLYWSFLCSHVVFGPCVLYEAGRVTYSRPYNAYELYTFWRKLVVIGC